MPRPQSAVRDFQKLLKGESRYHGVVRAKGYLSDFLGNTFILPVNKLRHGKVQHKAGQQGNNRTRTVTPGPSGLLDRPVLFLVPPPCTVEMGVHVSVTCAQLLPTDQHPASVLQRIWALPVSSNRG